MSNEPSKREAVQQVSSEWEEYAQRSKAWFEHPEKDKIRRRAKKAIKRRIADIVLPLGFVSAAQGTGWEIERKWVIRGIYVQASRSGDRCYFNLAKKPKYKVLGVLSAKREVKRLSAFYRDKHDRVGETGSLYYYDIEQLPQYVDQAMNVIENAAIPWLLK